MAWDCVSAATSKPGVSKEPQQGLQGWRRRSAEDYAGSSTRMDQDARQGAFGGFRGAFRRPQGPSDTSMAFKSLQAGRGPHILSGWGTGKVLGQMLTGIWRKMPLLFSTRTLVEAF